MRDAWTAVRLSDDVKVRSGYAFKSSSWKPSGHAVVKIRNVLDGALDLGGCSFVDDEVASIARSKGAGLKPNDILIGMTGYVGRVARVPPGSRLLLNQRVGLVEPTSNRIADDFLYYLLRSERFQRYAVGAAKGSAQPNLSPGDIGDFTYILPPMAEQQRIAGVLGALDELIETNDGLTAKLISLADLEWQSAAEGAGYERLGDHITLTKGISYKGKFLAEEGGVQMLNLGNFGRDGRFKLDSTKSYSGPIKPDRMLSKDDLVVANTDLTQARDILGRPLLVPADGMTSTHHTFQVGVDGGLAQRIWVYFCLRFEPHRLRLAAYGTGTTVAGLPRDALLELAVPWPDPVALQTWHEAIHPLLESEEALIAEAEDLKTTRDELIPLLLSGRLCLDGGDE